MRWLFWAIVLSCKPCATDARTPSTTDAGDCSAALTPDGAGRPRPVSSNAPVGARSPDNGKVHVGDTHVNQGVHARTPGEVGITTSQGAVRAVHSVGLEVCPLFSAIHTGLDHGQDTARGLLLGCSWRWRAA